MVCSYKQQHAPLLSSINLASHYISINHIYPSSLSRHLSQRWLKEHKCQKQTGLWKSNADLNGCPAVGLKQNSSLKRGFMCIWNQTLQQPEVADKQIQSLLNSLQIDSNWFGFILRRSFNPPSFQIWNQDLIKTALLRIVLVVVKWQTEQKACRNRPRDPQKWFSLVLKIPIGQRLGRVMGELHFIWSSSPIPNYKMTFQLSK